MNNNKTPISGVLGGILLIIYAIFQAILSARIFFVTFVHIVSILELLLVAGLIFTAVVLFLRRNDMVLGIALCIPACVSLIKLFIFVLIYPDFIIGLKFFLTFLMWSLLAAAAFSSDKGKFKKLRIFYILIPLVLSSISVLQRPYLNTFYVQQSMLDPFLYLAMILIGTSLTYKPKQYDNASEEAGYINMGKHILLCVFTFGIWYLIWVYRTTSYLNRAPDAEQYNPATKLLLFIFVPFYSIYWFYKHGQRIDSLTKSKNLNASDMEITCLVLGIFIPIIACFLMQDRINSISVSDTGSFAVPEYIENLKQLKELLDDGVITQEEFAAKKKQILGL